MNGRMDEARHRRDVNEWMMRWADLAGEAANAGHQMGDSRAQGIRDVLYDFPGFSEASTAPPAPTREEIVLVLDRVLVLNPKESYAASEAVLALLARAARGQDGERNAVD